jgi:hypothetical protein
MRPPMDRERLAAFVDGALSPEDAATVVMHLADHPQDQAYVDDLISANELLADAYAAPLHEPVPPAILAAIMAGKDPAPDPERTPGGGVLPFRPRRAAPLWIGAVLALAASVAAVAILLTGPPGPGNRQLLTVGPVAPSSDLGRVLAGVPSLVPETLADRQEVMVLSTLRTADGRYCREVEVIDQGAGRMDTVIACTEADGGWAVEIAVQEPLRSDDGDSYVTASGSGPGILGPFLDQKGVGLVLDAEAEAQAIQSGWAR